MFDEDALIRLLKRRRDAQVPAAPLTEDQLRAAEDRLGFALPTLLRRLYREIGNGDFGPGLFPLTLPGDDAPSLRLESIVAWYRGLRDNPPTEEDFDPEVDEAPLLEWPEKLLMICDWGCNIYSCVDCSKPELPVLRNDNNVSWSMFALEAPSLHKWFERWLEGERLFWLDWDAAPRVQFPATLPPNTRPDHIPQRNGSE